MSRTLQKWQTPGVRCGPRLQRGFRRGVDQLVDAISPTLGPRPRLVVNQSMLQNKGPEFLDDGAVIARRIIMLPARLEDVGAMYLRQMLWNVRETVGDGTATAAVLFRSIYDQGLRYLAAGGQAMSLRRYLEQAAGPLLEALDEMAEELSGKERLAGYAKSICHDADLAEALAEAFDMLGPDGRLEIRSGRSRQLVLEFFDGIYWEGGLFDYAARANSAAKVSLVEPAILLTDLEVKEPRQIVPLLDLVLGAGIQSLLLVSPAVSESVLPVLALPANRQRLQVAAAKTPTHGAGLRDNLEDISLLVGGRPLLKATGDTLESVRLENLGGARRAWADKEYFGLEAGKGDPRKLRMHIAQLRQALARARDNTDRNRLQQRLGQLIYGSAVLWVGATTLPEIERRKESARRAITAMRGALRDRVVLGGAVALLALKPAMQTKARQAQNADERAAYNILHRAVDAPIRTLLSNAGQEPEAILAKIAQSPCGSGWDVTQGCMADMRQAGIVDAASVVKTALGSAIESAALALTIDVLVQRANPPMGLLRQ